MTEAEVLEQLEFFEQAIISLKADKKALKGDLESAKAYEGLYNDLYNAFASLKAKAYGTVKHLVEDVIEKQEKSIEDLRQSLDWANERENENVESMKTLRESKDALSELIDYLYAERANKDAKDVSFEEKEDFLRKDFSIRLADVEEVQKAVLETNTKNADLENQITELTEKHEKEVNELNAEIEGLKSKAEELNQNGVALADYKKRVDDLINQNNETKKEAETEKEKLEIEISNLKVSIRDQQTRFEEEKQKFDETSKVETERLTAKVKSLEETKAELEQEKAELLEKIKRLEAEKSVQVQPRVIEQHNEQVELDKDVHSFRFGRTTKAIISKASHFIEALYNNCTETDTYFELNNPGIAAEMAQITEKEMSAFIKQMTIVKYAGQPLIYEFEGRWRSTISMRKMIDYIKEEI